MCGIVGLYLKDRRMEREMGGLFATMLVCMTDRGPDSAGFAVYGNEPPEGWLKVTVRHSGGGYDWDALSGRLGRRFSCEARLQVNANYAVIAVRAAAAELRRALAELAPGLAVMSIGRSIEIFKEIGAPASIVERFAIRGCAAPTSSAIPAWPPRARSPPTARTPSPPAWTCAWCTTGR